MGGLCSKGSAVDKSPSDTTLGPGRVVDHHDRLVVKEEKKAVVGEAAAKKMQEEQHQRQQPPPPPQSVSVSQTSVPGVSADSSTAPWDGVPHLARLPSQRSGIGVAKATAKASFQYFLLCVHVTGLMHYAHREFYIFFPCSISLSGIRIS